MRAAVRSRGRPRRFVSITDQVLIVWPTLIPKYSFTSQNPASLTWLKKSEPVPIASTSRAACVVDISAASGATRPAAEMVATVAEPVARRMATAMSQASSSAGIDQLLEKSRIIRPTPTSISVCLKPPPAPTISRMPAIGASDFSTVEESRSLVNPAARPSVNIPTMTAASRAMSGEPMTSVTRWMPLSLSSTTMSTSALPSMRTTGSARCRPK